MSTFSIPAGTYNIFEQSTLRQIVVDSHGNVIARDADPKDKSGRWEVVYAYGTTKCFLKNKKEDVGYAFADDGNAGTPVVTTSQSQNWIWDDDKAIITSEDGKAIWQVKNARDESPVQIAASTATERVKFTFKPWSAAEE